MLIKTCFNGTIFSPTADDEVIMQTLSEGTSRLGGLVGCLCSKDLPDAKCGREGMFHCNRVHRIRDSELRLRLRPTRHQIDLHKYFVIVYYVVTHISIMIAVEVAEMECDATL